jgi:hypothetical protein
MVAKSDAGIRFSKGRGAAVFAEKQAQRTPTTKPGRLFAPTWCRKTNPGLVVGVLWARFWQFRRQMGPFEKRVPALGV